MLSLFLALAAFALYFLYDINSITRRFAFARSFFGLGTALLLISMALDLYGAWRGGCISGIWDAVILGFGAVFFCLLMYSLFFALPFETYTEQSGGKVCRRGLYALCRHPGAIIFWILYLLMGLAMEPAGLLPRFQFYSVLNLAYVWFQDRVVFPKTFCDYKDYRRKVPFLIPTRSSIRQAAESLRRADSEEDKP